MSTETRNTILYGQLHEGLAIHLMKAPTVSSATDYACLCMAARNEERRQAELQRRRAYQTLTQRQPTSAPNHTDTRQPQWNTQQPPRQPTALQGRHNPSRASALKGPGLQQEPDQAVVQSPVSIAGSRGTLPKIAQNPRERA